VPPSIWPINRASLLFTLVTAAVAICLMTAAGARADVFDDAQAALEQAAAQTGGAPPPVAPVPAPASPAPAKKVEQPKKSPDTGGVAAPSAMPDPSTLPDAPDNVNISIRVESPGNDGPVTQGSSMRSQEDFDRLERHFDKKFAALKKQIEQVPAATPKVVIPVVRHETPKPPPPKPKAKHLTHVAPQPPHPTPDTRHPGQHTAAPVHERHVHRTAAPTHQHPFHLPTLPDNQAMSAGSSGGTSTPPPAPIAALLAAACLAASMLVTGLWDAHRRRRSRLFASRLERPG
jgi:hypothetical protein